MKSNEIKNIVSQMTIEEKALMLTGGGGMQTAEIERLGIKGVRMTDGPHGIREIKIGCLPGQEMKSAENNHTSFPCLSAVGASWNRDIAYKMGEAIAKECINYDIGMLLGPGVNIKRIDLCGRNFEYFSEDPVLSGEMAAGYINGVQDLGVATSLKHFAVNNQEVDRLFVSAEIDERTMREVYLKAFEIAVKKSNPTSIMTALNKVNSVLCSENKFLLTDVLRDEWGYEGISVSDWGCSKHAGRSVQAGLDLQMPQKVNIVEEIKAALEEGTVTMEAIDTSVERVLNFVMNHKPCKVKYDRDEMHAVAREIEEESIVLLKNEEKILPLNSKKHKKIAVIGGYAEDPVIAGKGSAQVYVKDEWIDKPIDCLRKMLPDSDIQYVPIYKTDSFMREMCFEHLGELTSIEDADAVVMFVGRQHSVDTEGTDRVTIHLDPMYEFFIKRVYPKNKNIILVVQAGGAFAPLNWEDKVKGIVQMWYGGEGAGSAIANVLCGAVNPSGKLSETFPYKTRTDIDYPGDGYKVCYDEKWKVGYRYYDIHPEEIWYPFGYGLSYTDFEYKNLKINQTEDGIEVLCNVENIGDVEGKEVVQLYVSDVKCTVSRPVKELKDFEKINLKPGETKTVKFTIPYSELAFYNLSMRKWTVEPGKFEIMIGSSSRDIRLKGEYNYTGRPEYTLHYIAEQIVG